MIKTFSFLLQVLSYIVYGMPCFTSRHRRKLFYFFKMCFSVIRIDEQSEDSAFRLLLV